jgi:ankyrin repeat protein
MLSKKIPESRISTFSYSAEGTDKVPIYQRLEMIAKKLLLGLDRIRSAVGAKLNLCTTVPNLLQNNTKTPIVFVCHSMGGIILTHMLAMAQAYQDEYRFIYPYVAGAIFLGTPFRGTSETRALVLAEMAQSIVMSKPSDVVSYLERDNVLLDSMFKRFVGVFQAAHMRLYCFYEEEPVKSSSKRQDCIVDSKSAEIDGVGSLGLKVDHFQLNKYDGAKDPNFTFVSEEIRVITSKAESILKTRQNAQIQELVDDLTYSSMKNHLIKPFQNQNLESLINGQYGGSQSGILLEQAAFNEWNQQDTSKLLWVHGEAGTGQNAVASSAITSLKTSSGNGSIVTSFYCDEKGEVQSRSVLGLLQLIIYQIIRSNRDLAVHLLSDSKKGKESRKQGFNADATLRVQVLWDALQSMAKYLSSGSIYIIIYGLEQLLPDALDEFLSYLTELSDASPLMDESYENVPIKWMLLSRSGRPNIEKSLSSRALEIDLRDKATAALVSNDLRIQISERVNELELPSSLGYFVKRHVHSRAEDNEIYIKLVIQELKNAWVPGKTHHADIRKLLESFPYGLTNMFEHIQKRVLDPQAEGLEYTKEILRCQICAHVSPTLRDLAVMAGLPKEHREDLEILKSYIIRCGAFLTLNGGEWDLATSTVEWINISAQDYLKRQAKDVLALELQGMQNGIIALRCLEYVYEVLDADVASREKSEDDDQVNEEDGDENNSNHSNDEDDVEKESENGSENDDIPEDDHSGNGEGNDEGDVQETNGDVTVSWDDSTDYPFRYWVEHAKLAPRDVLDEFDLENQFWRDDSKARQKWWQFNQHMDLDEDEAVVSALQMAVILQFPALVEYLLEHGKDDDTHTDDSNGFQPLYYACQGGNEDIVNALLGANANINYTSSGDKPTALHAAASHGHQGIVQILLDRDADVDATSPDHGTALYAAIANHDHKITELLLERDAQVNIIGGAALRALNIGALVGNLEGVRELIDHDADIDPDEEYWYGSALGGASRNGHADMVEFLLSSGWSPSRTMKTYGSFLTAAATYKHLAVVEILLEKEDRTPVLEMALQAAAQRGYVAIVEAILDKKTTLRLGKVFSKAAYYGRTEVLKVLFERDTNREIKDDNQLRDNALYQATDNEHEETVKMLLEYGADPNAEGPTYGFALAASAYDGTTGIMQALLAKGANVNKRGGEYGTALQAAAFRGDSDNVEILLSHGAVLNTDPIGYYGNELQAAVFTGDETTIKLLIDRGANVNAFGGHYSYAIIAAVQRGYSDATKVLLENHADVNVRGGDDNWPVISLAASTLRKEDLQLILDRGADINATCDKETAALLNCAAAGDDDGLEFLLEHGADVHMISPSRGSALHVAA